MKKGLTELVFVLDRSGSMYDLEADTIGGFNAMLEKQKKEEGEAFVSTVLFNQGTKVIHDRVKLKEVAPMTEADYDASGSTALLDALGGAIRHIVNIHRYAREEDRPEHTMFVIMTDGLENASRSYSADEVRTMIRHEQEKYGWEFIFMGANIDAVETAERYGIREERAVNWRSDSIGTRVGYETMSDVVTAVRTSRLMGSKWKQKLEEDAKR